MAVRNIQKAIQVKETILKDTPDAKVDVMELDLSSMASIRNFAAKYRSLGLPLHILIYSSIYAYGLSKLANILHANELARLLKEEGVNITANSLHPGFIDTELFRGHNIFSIICNRILRYFIKDLSQGATTTCYLALNPQVKGVTGEFFVDSNLAKPSSRAKDQELAKELWEFSMGLTSSK
ncbi:putative very-long-chain 3-oxoacyl-CoA reductase [Helianthus annuus]|nr:putative very-long-chain 3-oxoacyl-CoA reductase [Helianthus annuus]